MNSPVNIASENAAQIAPQTNDVTKMVQPTFPVTRRVFEQQLERIKAECRNPLQGVFGPDSWMWEITRHTLVFAAGMGRRITLQVAHPWVTSAIDQHSKVRANAAGRARRTYHIVFQMIYGNLEQALKAAEIAHRVHAKIEGPVDNGSAVHESGSHYRANEAHAMLWIHTTMWDTFARLYQLFVRPMTPAELEAYYQETRRFAWLFGIPDEVLPPSWQALQTYFNDMVTGDELVVSTSTRQLAEFVLKSPHKFANIPIQWIKTMTIGLYPEKLRTAYGWESDTAAFADAIQWGKRLQTWLPARMRYLPAWHEAQSRLQGKRADGLTRRLNKRMFRTAYLVS